jgi:hypothetical protein
MMALLSWAAKRLGNSCSQSREVQERQEEDFVIKVSKLIPPSEGVSRPIIKQKEEKENIKLKNELFEPTETAKLPILHSKKRNLLFDYKDYPFEPLDSGEFSEFTHTRLEERNLLYPMSEFGKILGRKGRKKKEKGDYRVLLSLRKLKTSPIFNN